MNMLERIKDAKDVWVKCKGTMIALDQDDVHELWEEIIKIQTRNSRQRRKSKELLKKYNELKSQLQQKENIIKEVREYVKEACWLDEVNKPNALGHKQTMKILEILDGENNDK